MPEDVLKIIINSIRKGNNSFVFINDAIVQKALVNIGQSPEDAAEYTLIGCYEPASVGKEMPCTTNGRLSLPAMIDQTLNNGRIFSDFTSELKMYPKENSTAELHREITKLHFILSKAIRQWEMQLSKSWEKAAYAAN
jgi:pyruvate-formate lyase